MNLRNGTNLFTVRSDNWNEKLGIVPADQIAVVAGAGGRGPVQPVTLRHILQGLGHFGGYAGLEAGTNLFDANLDAKCSIRFQTTFIPVQGDDGDALGKLEFATEAYNYNTMDDSDPRNLVLLCTSQGVAVQQDGSGAKKLFHHAVDDQGQIHRYWLEAEESKHKVGGEQRETEEERAEAQARGKATSSVIGIRAYGTALQRPHDDSGAVAADSVHSKSTCLVSLVFCTNVILLSRSNYPFEKNIRQEFYDISLVFWQAAVSKKGSNHVQCLRRRKITTIMPKEALNRHNCHRRKHCCSCVQRLRV